jgi:hypothetical protein
LHRVLVLMVLTLELVVDLEGPNAGLVLALAEGLFQRTLHRADQALLVALT